MHPSTWNPRWHRNVRILIFVLVTFSLVQPSVGARTAAALHATTHLAVVTAGAPTGDGAGASPGGIRLATMACDVRDDLVASQGAKVHRFEAASSLATDHARVVLDPNVTQQDQELIAEAVRLAEDFFAFRLGASLGSEVTVTALPIACPRHEGRIASTVGESMVIYTGSSGWLASPPAERIRTVVHEYTHTYQFSKAAEAPYASAAWLEEGVAEYLSMIALSELGLMNREAIEGLFGEIVNHSDLPPLQDLEDLSAIQSQPGQVYPLAYFGVAQLLQDLPLARIDAYYTALAQGQTFAAAFELAFDVSPEVFYEQFAQFRASSLPAMGYFPEELEIAEGVDQPSAVTVTESPAFVIPGQQALVVAETQPGANCTLDLTAADATVAIDDRMTFASGAGEVFWLLTIPPSAPAGEGVFTVSCGSEPVTTPVIVS